MQQPAFINVLMVTFSTYGLWQYWTKSQVNTGMEWNINKTTYNIYTCFVIHSLQLGQYMGSPMTKAAVSVLTSQRKRNDNKSTSIHKYHQWQKLDQQANNALGECNQEKKNVLKDHYDPARDQIWMNHVSSIQKTDPRHKQHIYITTTEHMFNNLKEKILYFQLLRWL